MVLEQLNPHSCRSYVIGTGDTPEVTIIDPVLDHIEDYVKFFRDSGYTLTHVVDTHTHADHISAAAALKDMTDCEYIMHRTAPARCATFLVRDEMEFELSGLLTKVIHTPGHTKDSICLVVDGHVFTGDALFLDDGGAGRDDLPGGDPGKHWESLQRLMQLPEDLVVLPAHDYRNRKSSTIGVQKTSNPHLRPRSKTEFVQYLEDLRLGPADWMKDVLKANYACARDPKAAWIPIDMPACEIKGTMSAGVNDQQVSSVSARELRRKLKSGQAPVLVDVREAVELDGPLGHLPGILHIPIGSLTARLGEIEVHQDRDIVIVCRSGARAHTAAQILMQAGFARVNVLVGGMMAYRTSS